MFKIQTYLLLTKFTYFISSDMYFCNKSSVSGSSEVVFFFSIEYPTCHYDNALKAHEKILLFQQLVLLLCVSLGSLSP